MPFNKGDFTQQGVAGHVNANIRLNEKRLVNIDLTSNEEAEGCTIAGTVTDLLNDKVYPIGSAPSGNIEITENTAEGEPLDISQYATATVNVSGGGGGIYTTAITFINNTGNNVILGEPHIDDTAPANVIKNDVVEIANQGEYTLNIPIFQNEISDGHTYGGTLYLTGGYNVSASDAINCSYSYDSMFQQHAIAVTDISSPSSITITLSSLS